MTSARCVPTRSARSTGSPSSSVAERAKPRRVTIQANGAARREINA
ncbi:hypothetical protein [Micromonospora sp. 050-3]